MRIRHFLQGCLANTSMGRHGYTCSGGIQANTLPSKHLDLPVNRMGAKRLQAVEREAAPCPHVNAAAWRDAASGDASGQVI